MITVGDVAVGSVRYIVSYIKSYVGRIRYRGMRFGFGRLTLQI